jgi:hypothetical protein
VSMSVRSVWPRGAAPVAAVALGVLSIAMGAATVVLDSIIHQAGTGGPVADAFAVTAVIVPTTAVGTLLAARRPRNPIGWLILAIVIGQLPNSEYAVLDYRMHHGTLPLGSLAVVLDTFWPLSLFSIAALLWLFPDGKMPAGRWRRPSRVLLVAGLLICLAAASGGLQVVLGHDIHIGANGDIANPVTLPQAVLSGMVIAGTLVSWVAWLAVQAPAYRRADGERRQQLKWLYSGAVVFVISEVIGVFIVPVAMRQVPGWGTQAVSNDLTDFGVSALPLCMGVAVLKYRLYELNRIISRVVSYTLITVLLAGVYVGLILLATRVLPVRGSVAVVGVTLVIAALFNPLRRRVRRVVDRRFNRSRYDAEAVVAAFSSRLRHTVDLDPVRRDLIGVTHDAFQPVHVSMWLAPAIAAHTAPGATAAKQDRSDGVDAVPGGS